MEYNHRQIEQKWQKYWAENKTYAAEENSTLPKYYVLDMFPYPSGAGLHVGHPLGYIASDIYARYRRHCGYNVLHPMGYDAFGLPAEQYAIQTGQHPAITTENNIARYRSQLDKIGLSFDWGREVRTCQSDYYRWTQWIFIQLYNSYYDNAKNKACHISELVSAFEKNGNETVKAACDDDTPYFSAAQWNAFSGKEKEDVLAKYRLTYLSETEVNWCPGLGTVLANDEIKDGLSERGGFPVERKKMLQWSMRITAYAQRLIDGLDTIDWADSIKESQRYWIGRSEGASVWFTVDGTDKKFEIFTTRPDTIFGITFMTLAPEHPLVMEITTPEQKKEVEEYIHATAMRSERERMADIGRISGAFTGAYALHPFTGDKIPVYIGDYVLAGYGTGAVMAVPAGDTRDYAFAKHFNIPIKPILEGKDISKEAYTAKDGTYIHDFIAGADYATAVGRVIDKLEQMRCGRGKIQYRLRDAVFSRQRYWGEPFPVYYKDGMPYMLDEKELPVLLPEVDKYLPTETGEPPLGHAKNWVSKDGYPMELNTMPGWAGSSWYFLRYMDPHNTSEFASEKALEYWRDVDLYIGGSEHATGHLLYSRFWHKFLHDMGYVPTEEPFKKLINQGMILGTSAFVYRVNGTNTFVSAGKKDQYQTTALHADVSLVQNNVLDTEGFKKWRPEYATAEFILEDDGRYLCGSEVEKMSKSKFNVVNPDDIVESYGADTLRLYEMFLGPLEQSKPWKTEGINGVSGFLKKMWRMYFDKDGNMCVTDETPTKEEMKTLHRTIKKVTEDIEHFSYNTSVSAFMIAVNELKDCHKRAVLEPLAVLISPFAPHIAEELWSQLGHQCSVARVSYPTFDDKYLIETTFEYPVMVRGKLRFKA
ncbi:MAG: leucine--tRNA ligase [Flavobacteriales bacterium]|nr:leucine--tRNA ligase [Flavobacteriales bacterium]